MLKQALQLRLGQQLTMTPQLQQAIRLLQLPALELQQTIREALEQNVMLEADDEGELLPEPADAGAAASPEATPAEAPADEPAVGESDVDVAEDPWDQGPTAVASEAPWSGDNRPQEFSDGRGETLKEHLSWQLELARLGPREFAIGAAIIDAINDDGYLVDALEEIGAVLQTDVMATPAEIERVLGVIQAFEPAGVAARSVAECIELQLAQLVPDTPGLANALRIARGHLDLVASRDYAALRRTLEVDEEELGRALALVRSCHPRPGSTIQPSQPDYVVPDVYARRGPHGWVVELNASALPRVRLNQGYAGLITRAADHAVMRSQLQEARWLLRSLEIRNETLLKVARCIVERQAASLERGDEAMEPMVLRDVAEAVDMHESTISRVTTGKYMHTPRGVYEFRYFFSSHVAATDGTEMSSTAIRAKIRKLIAGEDPANPLSDNRIAELLAEDGAQVARRTVAKYREAMQIAPSGERRKLPAR
ncbi:MAG TPA: RNA polymerase factor sigma-54 [Steroidobacteraceae bacterium]|nr:RNA polymerase factor sigma-54 [Steroidobacteraceae bacterium]